MKTIRCLLAILAFCFVLPLAQAQLAPDPVPPAALAATNAAPEEAAVAEKFADNIPKANAPAAPVEIPKKKLADIIKDGGWMMYVLAVMSLVMLSFILYFIIVLRQRNFTPPGLVRDIKRLIAEGRTSDAIELCKRNRSPSAAIAFAALNYVENVDDPDPAMLSEIMEGEGARQAAAVNTQTQYLLDIAVVSPMCGLLGTVMGMLETFNVVALDIAKAQPIELAGGVSKALVTTAAGLLVGIPAMVAYSYFRGRTSTLLSNMEIVATDLLTLLVGRRSK